MVFGFWSRSKEERGCLPALANFRAWLPHSKQIIEKPREEQRDKDRGLEPAMD
jgi:hypothetical protein